MSRAIVGGRIERRRRQTGASTFTKKQEMETLLKKREILRDEDGRFLQHGEGIKKAGKKPKTNYLANPNLYQPGHNKPGPGRPKGSQSKTTLALKEMILQALDEAGGVNYLRTLAVENSSAFAGLVAKVLPSTLQASDSDGGPAVIEFRRVIVMPDGTKHIEGVTPKQLPAPKVMSDEYYEELRRDSADPHTLPSDEEKALHPNEIKDLDE